MKLFNIDNEILKEAVGKVLIGLFVIFLILFFFVITLGLIAYAYDHRPVIFGILVSILLFSIFVTMVYKDLSWERELYR